MDQAPFFQSHLQQVRRDLRLHGLQSERVVVIFDCLIQATALVISEADTGVYCGVLGLQHASALVVVQSWRGGRATENAVMRKSSNHDSATAIGGRWLGHSNARQRLP